MSYEFESHDCQTASSVIQSRILRAVFQQLRTARYSTDNAHSVN